jgi:hypothetical protein
VIDEAGNAVPGATVQVVGGASAVTNSEGIYIVPVSGPGVYDLTAAKTGYSTGYKLDVVVEETGTTALPIVLRP